MSKYFYSHIIDIESLVVELDKLDLEDHEKLHLSELVDSSLHNTVLDAILSELSEEDKKIFLKHLENDEVHEKIWEHLNSKVDNIEEKIKIAADSLKEDLDKDLKEAHKLKKVSRVS